MDEPGARSGTSLGRRKTIAMLRSHGSTKRGDAGAWGYPHINPYSTFHLDMRTRIPIRQPPQPEARAA
jgi:hypothetical protein